MIYKKFLVVCIVLCTIYNIRGQDDDDFDGVTIEEEIDTPSLDIPYESPTLTDKTSVYLAEHFDDKQKVAKKWIKSQAKKDDTAEEIAKYDGIWEVEAPQRDSLQGDLGLVLKSKAKHAAISAKLDKPFVFQTKPLVVQYEVLLQDGQECGGAYLKLLSEGPGTSDLKVFQDKTPYTIMFGPDKCGNDHKLHFIFKHKNPKNSSIEEKHCRKPKDRLEDYFRDKIPHLYTLIVRPDNSFEIWLDRKIVNSGSLLEDFTPPVNPSKEIDDPADKKPQDWDEREKIPDPEAIKPDDWDENAPPQIIDKTALKPDNWLDDEEPMIPDPEAKQPEDWDTEMDGDWEPALIENPKCATADGCGKWEPPTISNPAYKGKWRAPLIDNPNYKGKWLPRRIPNPDYFEDLIPFKMTTIGAVGFELWSMSQDILFDNIIITDDIEVANKWASDTFELKRRKIARESHSLWGKMMKSMNYKPGWWALYFIYCLIPLSIYFWYMRKRSKEEESFVARMLTYAEEKPWLWIVYILSIGLPIILILYCCCNFGNRTQEREVKPERDEYDAATTKKTDAVTKDDEPAVDDDNKEETEDLDEEEEDEEDVEVEKKDESKEKKLLEEKDSSEEKELLEEKEELPGNEGQGDVPRKRKVRKE